MAIQIVNDLIAAKINEKHGIKPVDNPDGSNLR
jgi:hypothetical protein